VTVSLGRAIPTGNQLEDVMSQIIPRIATGTPGLDKMIKGGLLPGSIYTIAGPPGSGKTILAVQFLIEGVKRGENVLLVALDEHPCEMHENLLPMFGEDFDRILVLDGMLEMKSYEKTPLRDVSITRHAEAFGKVFPEIPRSSDMINPELTVSAIQEMIKVIVRNESISRVVIDSVTSLKMFMMTANERISFLQSFLRFLSDLSVTSMVTIQESDFPTVGATDIEYIMSRGVIRLYRWLQNDGFVIGISIDKFRGSDHDENINRIKITPIGLQVLDKTRRADRGR